MKELVIGDKFEFVGSNGVTYHRLITDVDDDFVHWQLYTLEGKKFGSEMVQTRRGFIKAMTKGIG